MSSNNELNKIITSLVTQAVTELTCNTTDEDEFEDALQELVIGLLMFEDAESVLVIETIVDEQSSIGDIFGFDRYDASADSDYDDDDDYETDDFFGHSSLDREIL